MLVLFVAYVVSGRAGLALAFVHASATAVWPPTGIALAGLLLLGSRVWPVVFAGAFVVNATTGGSLPVCLAIAAGNTLEAVAGAWLVNRFAGGTRAFEEAGSFLAFAALAGIVATTISASIGVTTLVAAGTASWAAAPSIWLTWWLGDAVGAWIVTPVLVLWARRPRIEASARWMAEAVLLALTLVLVNQLVFGGWFPSPDKRLPIAFFCLPIGMWAAFRFGPRETATAMLVLAVLAARGTLQDLGPFARDGPQQSLLLLQAFLGVMGVLSLTVAALVSDRARSELAVRQVNEALEGRIRERTAELARSEARLLEAQEVAHIGSWEWHVLENRLWWSDELYRIYGLDPQAAIGYEDFMTRVHPDDRAGAEQAVQAALAAAAAFAFEHRIVRPDGTVRWLLGRGRVVVDGSGRPLRMLGTGQDITDWKRLELERAALADEQAARRQAEAANRQKDEFLATLSHELRTPLNAIVGWLQILMKRPLEDSTRHAVDVLWRNAGVLRQLIEDVLDVSAIVGGKLRLTLQDVDVALAVQAAVESLRPVAEAKPITLHCTLAEQALTVRADSHRLQQIVSNLVANAVKFTPAGGRVDVALVAEDGAAAIRVTDTGSGIARELLPFVFDRFWQGDSSFTRVHGGLGLGLAIVRHLAELHGGSVVAESAGSNLGASFTVRIPLAAGPAAAETRQDIARTAAADLRGVRVLVVDDQEDARELVTTGLSLAGARVDPAASAAGALRLLDRAAYDLVVADIAMPDVDGYSLIARMRQAGIRIPALALTAYGGEEDRQRALDAGFDGHLAKPFNLEELVASVLRLGRRRET